ncbi:DUF2125 domain-containing protein [Paracoccus sp. SY]|uniref:DUF2125 domain-containing protein n=1 Tax=Paracoccus sp. SY TaxID=1330255 RepID=UPI001304A556|nr:DUF2125 domain-containing protein [Paracoccus sp. SY]
MGRARLPMMIVLLLAGAWLVAEPLLVSQARRHVQADTVDGQPGPLRLGLALQDLTVPVQAGAVTLPRLDAWVTPWAPLTARAILPPTALLDTTDGQQRLELSDATARIRLSPIGGRLRHLETRFAGVGLDGTPLSGQGGITLQAVSDDRAEGVAYDIHPDLPDLHFPQLAALSGGLRLWLDRPIGLSNADAQPVVQRVLTEGLDIDARRFRLRVVGLILKGADGRVEGRLAIYASDAGAMLESAAEQGVLPPQVGLLVRAMLNRIGQADFSGPPIPGQPPMPAAPEGELRIPVEMRDGQMYLGGIQIGPAPVWPDPSVQG